jgi:hypothetical protein
MVSTSKLEMENFNGTNFELWKLKMEDLLIDQDLWVTIRGTKPIGMIDEEWVVLERKARSLIRLYLGDLVLVNVYEEKIATSLWKKLGYLYHAKSLVNKKIMWKKLFSLRMGDCDSVVEHLNAFNTIVT